MLSAQNVLSSKFMISAQISLCFLTYRTRNEKTASPSPFRSIDYRLSIIDWLSIIENQ